MTLPTLETLLTPKTQTQVRDTLLTFLGGLGFPVTSWQSGGVARTLVEGVAYVTADLWAASVTLGKGGFLSTAATLADGWLDLLADSHYDEERIPSAFAEGYVVLACSGAAGPYTITPGAFYVGVQASGSADARRFVALTGGTLNPSGTLTIRARAESPGVAYNLANGLTLYLFTPLAGVTATNPVYASGTWLALPGADAETNAAFVQRCRDKWSTLSQMGAVEVWYRYHVFAARMTDGRPTGITQVALPTPPGDGTLRVIVAAAGQPVTSDVVAAVQSYLATRKPPTDTPTVASATGQAVAITGTIRARDLSAANQARVTTALTALQSSLTIGALIDLGLIYQTIRAAGAAIEDVDLTSPTADTQLGSESVGTFTVTLTWSLP